METMTVNRLEWLGISGGNKSPAIDGKSQGNTTIFSNNHPTFNFYITNIDVILDTVSGLGTPPVINVGKNASNYTDVVSAFALTNLSSALTRVSATLVTLPTSLAPGESLVARVATAAIATTTYSFRVVARGFYA